MSNLKQTALTSWHAANGARLVDFAGWEMPVQYASGVMTEHRAVREAAGLFDVSHMAEFMVEGESARAALDGLVTNNIGKLEVGAAIYTALCNDRGTVLDDLLVYALTETKFMVVANAANHAKVLDWLTSRLPDAVSLRDETEEWALLALQGPKSYEILAEWSALAADRPRLVDLDYYCVFKTSSDDLGWVARTGYTGERGYELYLKSDRAPVAWEELLAIGQSHGLVPAGLGARDTLRLEAGFALYGQELDEESTPYESGIGWVVKLKKAADFVGKTALSAQKENGVPRRLVALRGEGRVIARQGAAVFAQDRAVGVVTSGTFSPTLEAPIALAKVSADVVTAPLQVEVRGQRHAVETVKLPFVPSRVRSD